MHPVRIASHLVTSRALFGRKNELTDSCFACFWLSKSRYALQLPTHGRGKWLALHAGASLDLLADAPLFARLAATSGISVETWKHGMQEEVGALLGAMLISEVTQ